MYLTLDIGNTRTKYAVISMTGELAAHGVLAPEVNIGKEFEECIAIGFCNVSNVFSPDFGGFTGSIMELSSSMELPFSSLYKTPQTLGADRIASVAGSLHRYPGKNIIVVDAGTCLKIELVSADGFYHGGSISPGLKMRYKALQHFTGRLPLIEHREFNEATGKSTEESILCGVQEGFLAETEGRIEQLKNLSPDAVIVYTGGDHEYLAKRAKNRIFAEPLLLHYGLYYCLRLNGY